MADVRLGRPLIRRAAIGEPAWPASDSGPRGAPANL